MARKKLTAADTAYYAIKDKILSGEYEQGQRITEKELTEATGVSRTPVREALNRLQSENLLTAKPHHGVVVREMSYEETLTVFELRLLLEPYCIRLAAANITDEEIAALEKVLEQQEIATKKRGKANRNLLGRLNARFHAHIYSASRRQRLITILAGLIQPMSMRWTFQNYSDDDLERSLTQHRELVKLLKKRDAESAEVLLKLHITAGMQHFKSVEPSASCMSRTNTTPSTRRDR